jgi:hypothetical protein
VKKFNHPAAALRSQSTSRPLSRERGIVLMKMNGQVMARRLAAQRAVRSAGLQFSPHKAHQFQYVQVCRTHFSAQAEGMALTRKKIRREMQNRVRQNVRPSERRDRLAPRTESHATGWDCDGPVRPVMTPLHAERAP